MRFRRLFQLTAISIFLLNLGILCTSPRILAAGTDDTGRCSSITLENAAAILGAAMADLQQSSHDLMVSPDDPREKVYSTPPFNCTIRSTANFLQSVTYVVYEFNDPGQARREFNRMREGFASVSGVEAVPDIGAEVFWAGDDRFQRMVAIKGKAMIDVLSPKDFNLQKQIISLVLDSFQSE